MKSTQSLLQNNIYPSLHWEGFYFLKTLLGGTSKIWAALNDGTTTELAKRTDVESLKTYVSDGKTQVANAITDKGVSASSSDTFATLATKILNIQSAPNTFTNTNCGSNYTESYTISNIVPPNSAVVGLCTVYGTVSLGMGYAIFFVPGDICIGIRGSTPETYNLGEKIICANNENYYLYITKSENTYTFRGGQQTVYIAWYK